LHPDLWDIGGLCRFLLDQWQWPQVAWGGEFLGRVVCFLI
jgi:hypothetical protein